MKVIHDPDADLDYRWRWDKWLAADEVITAAFFVVSDQLELTKGDESHTDTEAVVWLSGGTPSFNYYPVTCRITTNQGRTDDRSMDFRIVNR